MKRRLLGLVASVSAALFLAVVVLWVRSHQAGDDIGYSRGHNRYYLRTGGGEIAVELSRYDAQQFPPEFRWDTDPRRTHELYMIRRVTLPMRLGFYSDSAGIGMPTIGAMHLWMVP